MTTASEHFVKLHHPRKRGRDGEKATQTWRCEQADFCRVAPPLFDNHRVCRAGCSSACILLDPLGGEEKTAPRQQTVKHRGPTLLRTRVGSRTRCGALYPPPTSSRGGTVLCLMLMLQCALYIDDAAALTCRLPKLRSSRFGKLLWRATRAHRAATTGQPSATTAKHCACWQGWWTHPPPRRKHRIL